MCEGEVDCQLVLMWELHHVVSKQFFPVCGIITKEGRGSRKNDKLIFTVANKKSHLVVVVLVINTLGAHFKTVSWRSRGVDNDMK